MSNRIRRQIANGVAHSNTAYIKLLLPTLIIFEPYFVELFLLARNDEESNA
jgi:hypothetical protein